MIKEPRGVGKGGEVGVVRRVGWLRSLEGARKVERSGRLGGRDD